MEVVRIASPFDFSIRIYSKEVFRSGKQLHSIAQKGVTLSHSGGWTQVSPTVVCDGRGGRRPRNFCSFEGVGAEKFRGKGIGVTGRCRGPRP